MTLKSFDPVPLADHVEPGGLRFDVNEEIPSTAEYEQEYVSGSASSPFGEQG